MKRRIAALLLAALMLSLSGCGAILDREYRSVSRHISHTSDDAEDTSALRAENYSELVNSVQFFVSMGMDEGVVHLYQYSGEVEADLEAVCQEVLTRDPLGAWALRDIQWSRSPMISYEACTFTFDYRVDPSEIASIHSLVGTSAIREQLEQSLSRYDSTVLLQTSTYYARSDLLLTLVQDAYYAQPGSALGYPVVTIDIYPQDGSGAQHLVELSFSYPLGQSRLQEQAQRVAAAATTLIGPSPAQGSVGCWLLYSRLARQGSYGEYGAASVYNALVAGKANSEGIALAYQYLCEQVGLNCLTVQGTLDGAPHWWDLVELDDGWHHVDVTADLSQDDYLLSDTQAAERYTWDAENYPACPDPPEDETESETPADTDTPTDDGLQEP